MKKLMIVAAVALAASFANAASCSWACEAFGTYNNDASEGYTFNYAIICLGDTAVDASKISYDGSVVTVNGVTTAAVISDTADGWGASDITDQFVANKYYTMVIYDAVNQKYGVGAIAQALMDTTPGATDFSPLYFESASGINVDDDGTYSGIMATESVPEPTSGLLLLLGVAGLALRRRRA